MKRVLVYGRDPGGTNALIPIVKKISEHYKVLVLAKGKAKVKFEQYNIHAENLKEYIKSNHPDEIRKFLEAEKYDFIITETGGADDTKKYLWTEGKKLGIPSFGILDQWVNCAMRFANVDPSETDKYCHERKFDYLPNKIMVMDQYVKQLMIKEGIPAEIITVSGQPYFEQLKKDVQQITEDDIITLKKKWNVKDELIYVFASEPILDICHNEQGIYGYNEQVIFNYFRESIEKLSKKYQKKAKIIIRPHPKENLKRWKQGLDGTSFVSYCIDNNTDSRYVIKAADVIVGMTSMFLIESAILGKKVLSVQIGLNTQNDFILDHMGVVPSILTEQELEKQLRKTLERDYPSAKISFPLGATDRIIKEMEEML